MSHTAGPYKVEDYGMMEALDIVTVDGEAIIGSACIDTERGVDYVQMQANARLMAAAPALLAALRPILDDPTVFVSEAHRAAGVAAIAFVDGVEP